MTKSNAQATATKANSQNRSSAHIFDAFSASQKLVPNQLKTFLHTSPSASFAAASVAGVVAADLVRSTASTMKQHISEVLEIIEANAAIGINTAKQQSDNCMAIVNLSISSGLSAFATVTNELLNATDSFMSSISNATHGGAAEK